MPQRIFFIVVVLIFPFCGEILGQEKIVEKIPVFANKLQFGDVVTGTNRYKTFIKKDNPLITSLKPRSLNLSFLSLAPSFKTYSPVAKNFYSCNLTFFCRTELQIEKVTSVPLRFRLGSLSYTDYLEKKPNALLR